MNGRMKGYSPWNTKNRRGSWSANFVRGGVNVNCREALHATYN